MPKRILIAEDDEMSREMLTTFALSHGYEIVAVVDGIELLTTSVESKFDLVITDLMMGSLNGASATEILKMQGSTIPVIAITAASPDETLLIKDKFARIYHKPCNYSDLFEYVESLIGK
ncbi:MAG: response regulator [Desulfuromonadaceae bacterium]|nr:response regulator [Desulfuromonadaceae bacterium]